MNNKGQNRGRIELGMGVRAGGAGGVAWPFDSGGRGCRALRFPLEKENLFTKFDPQKRTC